MSQTMSDADSQRTDEVATDHGHGCFRNDTHSRMVECMRDYRTGGP